jgi:hypothetical protein
MEGILKFNLEDSADREAHLRAIKSTKLAIALWEMDQYLRAQAKYAPDSMPPEVYESLLKTRDKLREIMSEHSIDLDELIS